MQGVRRLGASGRTKLRCGSKLITSELDHANSATARQQILVLFCQLTVPCSVRHHENLEQRQRRRDQLPMALVSCCEERQDVWQVSWFLFYQVNEDRRVHRQRTGAKVSDQSHAARSRSTCWAASIPCQCSLPSPRSSRIESGFGDSRAALRIWATSCATDRRSRLARAWSLRYRPSGKFFTFSVAVAVWRTRDPPPAPPPHGTAPPAPR